MSLGQRGPGERTSATRAAARDSGRLLRSSYVGTPPDSGGTRRLIAFAAVVVLCVLGGGAFVAIAAIGGEGSTSKAKVANVTGAGPAPAAVAGRRVMARAADPEDPGLDGRVVIATLGAKGRPRPTGLACQRVYMEKGRGICLALAGTALDYTAIVFDRKFRRLHSLALDGLPSRARVSPDGRMGSVTSFVTGHSYAAAGEFSTSTRLIDLRSGRWVGDLEEDFEAYRDGQRFDAPDFNYWGVTFARGGREFYATLSTEDHRYLVRGDLRTKRVDVLRDKVECPSLSPDGTRIAYKRTLGGGRWRPHVLNLESGADTALAETRSIDDQIEWLDDDHVLYGDGQNIFMTPADGSGKPRRMLAHASSPAAIL
jgi:WD40-like Beta Propeller Repeat